MTLALKRRYHVPRSQVWEGSRGRQRGNVHFHIDGLASMEPVQVMPRIKRTAGQALCGKRPWYDRPPETEYDLSDEALCPRCKSIALRAGLLDGG